MAVAAASLIIPAALYSTMDHQDSNFSVILVLSRGTAIVLLVLYVMYLFFQLKTHKDLFEEAAGDEDQEEAQLTPVVAAAVLVVITLLVAVCAEYLVDSIDSIVETAHISKTFIGLILLPIVGNAAEHVTAVVVAMKDKVGSCLVYF